ncbi:MAG: hypothetical protein SV775_12020 [Thermodesulfobacteriota bacterium]|nr:hypothetical protein [Thermodesulfobacteriota bacterium]
MPIEYSVSSGGHFIYALATYPVTRQEFVDYEVDHAISEEIKIPVLELLEIRSDALRHISKDDVLRVLKRRDEIERLPVPHRCAIVVSYGDVRAWDLAKFYEGMVMLHPRESVVVFGDVHTAKLWLGVENIHPNIKNPNSHEQ